MSNPNMIELHAEVIYQGERALIIRQQDDGWRYTIQYHDIKHGTVIVSDLAAYDFKVVPKAGMGATMRYFSDRVACTVVSVSPSGRKVVVREDRSIRTDDHGMSDAQHYRYETNPEGHTHVFYRQGNGSYASPGVGLDIGYRDSYHDYSF